MNTHYLVYKNTNVQVVILRYNIRRRLQKQQQNKQQNQRYFCYLEFWDISIQSNGLLKPLCLK